MIAQMSVQFILALWFGFFFQFNTIESINGLFFFVEGPSAGIGRQDKLKIYRYNIVNVQVVSRIDV